MEMQSAVVEGDLNKVRELVGQAIDENMNPLSVINDGLIPGINVVGVRFKAGDMFVPEVLMSARTMEAGMAMLRPFITGEKMQNKGVVVIGTVKGDLHDIGKNLVSMLMRSSGYEVIDVGVDVSPERFIDVALRQEAKVIAMSAMLTTTMMAMKDTIDLFQEKGLRKVMKIIVGGAPVSQDFAQIIGADGFAPDAASAVDLLQNLI
ncbi:methyltransferase [Candidatus Formimonas warabiya]|uniref:Methyltransferase n=2 Tax=Formimonas warabiya TaxID=1761012 RepID=A0A3G1L2P7_FORW1|nr:methyltransferase [Candidatus Formimonas warabiya]